MRIKKVEKKQPEKITKLKRILQVRGISMLELHNGTKLSNPLLFNISEGRKTKPEQFDERSLISLGDFLNLPPEKFLGWEDKDITKQIRHLIESKDKKIEVKKVVKKTEPQVAEPQVENVSEEKKD